MAQLPVKFESILRDNDLNFGPLILRVDPDLRQFAFLRRFNIAQAAGTLAVICNKPGRGKTTASYAASILLKDSFTAVTPVPPTMSLPLRNLPEWLSTNLPQPNEKTQILLIDGRESTDDEQGLRDVMAAINNVVRGRPDLLFVWPTTDEGWRDRLVDQARRFGSQSLCPERAVFEIEGPDRSQWVEGAELVLNQIGSSWDEFGINEAAATAMIPSHETLGDFLTGINLVRAEQDDFAENVTGLPEVVFVVSSHSAVVGHVARLRNPRTYRLRTDEIIQSASRKRIGKFWLARGAEQKQNLAWVAGLMNAKLLSVTPSTVAHACYVYTDTGSRVKEAILETGFRGRRGTGQVAYSTTDLGRFIAGESVPEVLNSNKGKTSDETLAAYDEIQRLSSKCHAEINQAILRLASEASGELEFDELEFEKPLGGDAIVDAVVPVQGEKRHMEFHHVSQAHCNPNEIATYVMEKMQTYAIQYNLIDR